MAQWHGHTATTSASVLALLNKAQAAGTRFSHTERVLHTACEFWVAAVNHSLTRHLGNIPKVILRDAEAAFAAIEITSVANILRDARSGPLTAQPSVPAGQVAEQVQQTIDHFQEPVDELIGKFAAEQTWTRLKRPSFESVTFASSAHTAARSR